MTVSVLACTPQGDVQVRVIDGDTVDAGLESNVRLTLDDGGGFDTPETYHPGCAREAQLGQAASERLHDILRKADKIDLQLRSNTCGYGRYCGVLSADGVNVGDQLIREGLATLREGPLKAAIWRNEGENGAYHSVTLARTYKDREGNLQDTQSFRPKDMLGLSELTRRAHHNAHELDRASFKEMRQSQQQQGQTKAKGQSL